jgi:DNA-binding SARP family transcriptional activator
MAMSNAERDGPPPGLADRGVAEVSRSVWLCASCSGPRPRPPGDEAAPVRWEAVTDAAGLLDTVRWLRGRQQRHQQALRRLEGAESEAWARLTTGMTDPATPPAAGPVAPARPAVPGGRGSTGRGPKLAVHVLGPWRVSVDDCAVGPWPGWRRRSLLAFLVTHRHPAPTRETLMDALWPDTAPDLARNSLNVAVHGLRATLGAVRSEPMIVFSQGRYRFAPEVEIWLDTEDFAHQLERCRTLEDSCPVEIATLAYEHALGSCPAEVLADAPDQEWAAAPRERLRLAHLDGLLRLSALYFDQARYGPAAQLCGQILDRDPGREDAHRRLMRSHARGGQTHLALLAYHSCARVLADQFGIRPSAPTTALYEQLRRRQPV